MLIALWFHRSVKHIIYYYGSRMDTCLNMLSSFSNPNPFCQFNDDNRGDEWLFLSSYHNVISFELFDNTKMKSRMTTYNNLCNKYSKMISGMAADNYKNVLMPMSSEGADDNRIALKMYV